MSPSDTGQHALTCRSSVSTYPASTSGRVVAVRAGWQTAGALGAVVLGLVIGALTSYGQGWLTGTSNALVNSESAWLVAPFAVGALARRPWAAACLGLLTCLMQLVGYEITSELRDGAMSISLDLSWGVAAGGGGPPAGLARAWTGDARGGIPHRRGLAVPAHPPPPARGRAVAGDRRRDRARRVAQAARLGLAAADPGARPTRPTRGDPGLRLSLPSERV